jgi:tetratricopeptide (TPR) repeat protein
LKILLFTFVILVSGCAPQINSINANKYYDSGLAAEQSKSYTQAKEMYYRALVNARSGNATKEYVSATLYNYGRMLGFTCDYTHAVEAVKESLAIEKGISPVNNSNIAKRLSELGYLAIALGLNAEAATNFSEATPLLEKYGVIESDPIGYAKYLEIYAGALKSSVQPEKAKEISSKSENLIIQHAELKQQFTPVNYQAECAKKF